ncbi:formate/nitrite transporter family protein [Ornithinibacillus halophilus]|uniref:Nitrite transporter NirC n=1 Tax=Ornithinibacillus halophilus TaxID=930117 RepID=A0A1M5KJL0_9BACI|nr:formate/nitrite transporter family protein [Ornithinibacillus halophilus]SHG53044.1 nitrite transporter NirC [Ornithinibacillus halophilus]
MEAKPLLAIEKLALSRRDTFNSSSLIYLLRAVLASMFIGFGVTVAFRTGNIFFLEQSPWALPLAAATFGVAIILIAYGGGDLFTGDTFYYTFAALRKKMQWKIVGKMWAYSYVGNMIGAVFFAILIALTGLFQDESTNSLLISIALTKTQLSTVELFFRAILCNWLVCLAFFLPMGVKGDGTKIFLMMFLVFCFFISGYEHSIANMCTFAVSYVINDPNSVTMSGVIHNLIPVTIGNLIGGGGFMAWMYFYANKAYLNEEN